MFPLINRTHYSILQAFNKPAELVEACKTAGYTACGLCDLGTVSGAVEFLEACQRHSITPVVGCEFDGTRVFAKNLQGWKDLIGLVTEWNIHQTLNQQTLANSPHLFLLQVGSLPDCRYIDDEESYRILRASALKCSLRELTEDTSQYYFRKDISDPSLSSILDSVESYSIFDAPKLPSFAGDKTEIELLRDKCEVGFAKLISKDIERYRDRLDKELRVIELNNLSGYFLIKEDLINHFRSMGVLVGPGRGCFLPDSRVKMSEGTLLPIAFIKIGDSVIDAYGDKRDVIDIFEYEIDEDITEMEFEDGKIIRCTKDHKFLTENRGWVEAQNIDENDEIIEV